MSEKLLQSAIPVQLPGVNRQVPVGTSGTWTGSADGADLRSELSVLGPEVPIDRSDLGFFVGTSGQWTGTSDREDPKP